mmetsp:Transcript_42634/g.96395  ORF Transcript_42634/g.96395 Transcript_42634/m.96395 type:complete len:210 (+) Transcript_42634:142-771(+)
MAPRAQTVSRTTDRSGACCTLHSMRLTHTTGPSINAPHSRLSRVLQGKDEDHQTEQKDRSHWPRLARALFLLCRRRRLFAQLGLPLGPPLRLARLLLDAGLDPQYMGVDHIIEVVLLRLHHRVGAAEHHERHLEPLLGATPDLGLRTVPVAIQLVEGGVRRVAHGVEDLELPCLLPDALWLVAALQRLDVPDLHPVTDVPRLLHEIHVF